MQLTVTAHFSNGTTSDVTQTVAWESSNTLVATVTPAGRLTVHRVGDVRIRATLQAVEDVKQFRVTEGFVVKGSVEEGPPPRGSAGKLSNVIVEAEGVLFRKSTTTDSHGRYVLRAAHCWFHLTATKEGYESRTIFIPCDLFERTENLFLRPLSSQLVSHVFSGTGVPGYEPPRLHTFAVSRSGEITIDARWEPGYDNGLSLQVWAGAQMVLQAGAYGAPGLQTWRFQGVGGTEYEIRVWGERNKPYRLIVTHPA